MSEYSRVLSWHAAHRRSAGYAKFAADVLRSRSRYWQDVLAYIATDDRYNVTELHDIVRHGELIDIEPRLTWLASLGRAVALTALDEGSEYSEEVEFALACLHYANRRLSPHPEYEPFRRLEVELYMMLGQVKKARRVLESNDDLREFYYGYLWNDLDHPLNSGTQDTGEEWARGFNRPLTDNGLQAIEHSALMRQDFNSLTTKKVQSIQGEPKVSVIMTSYRPKRADFLTAVKSILAQSWLNLELIIVDDASPKEFSPTLTEAEALDQRVRLIRLENNQGTYVARNTGIAAATGEYMTGQDSDDWSHPERIAAQVQYLLANPSSPGVVVEAIRMSDDLVRAIPGQTPGRKCEVSFMLSLGLARQSGGYMAARKGADSEFRWRIEKTSGQPTAAIPKPLYFTRIGHDSLSRADFKPGWAHPVRRAFWNASLYWHEHTPPAELQLREDGNPPIPLPNRFKVNPSKTPPHFNVVYVADWRAYTSSQRAIIDEIVAHRRAGRAVGILQVDSLMDPSGEPTRLCSEIQALINSGEVEVVIPDEGASTDLTIVYDPTILQFSSENMTNLSTDIVLIRPDFPPPGASGSFIYLPKDCEARAKEIFSARVVWAASDPALLRALAAYTPDIVIHDELYPVVFHPDRWFNTRSRLRHQVPVIGRCSANHEEYWPEALAASLEKWTSEGIVDLRVLGDARSFLRRYNKADYPQDWLVYREHEIRPEAFMSSIDFFIDFPAPQFEQEFSREAMEAAASGAIVILPRRFERMHGRTAVYASLEEVPEVVTRYSAQTASFDAKVQENYKHFNDFHLESNFLTYLDRLKLKYGHSTTTSRESSA